jgi:hypothetical protein
MASTVGPRAREKINDILHLIEDLKEELRNERIGPR